MSRSTAPALLTRLRWWHLGEVLSIERLVFEQQPWTAEAFFSELAGVPDTRHYVAATTPEGVVLGYAGLALADDTADVMTVAVAPERQGRGVGRALLVELLGQAARRGVHEVFLEARSDNEPALGLYESLVFEPISRRRDYYAPGVDGLVMRRRGQWEAS
jgi:[ribosomal protein S18]-alanine N-acetyltransferase